VVALHKGEAWEETMVETRFGAVRGFADNGVEIFKGIP
jgi:carboxylesterase type B